MPTDLESEVWSKKAHASIDIAAKPPTLLLSPPTLSLKGDCPNQASDLDLKRKSDQTGIKFPPVGLARSMKSLVAKT